MKYRVLEEGLSSVRWYEKASFVPPLEVIVLSKASSKLCLRLRSKDFGVDRDALEAFGVEDDVRRLRVCLMKIYKLLIKTCNEMKRPRTPYEGNEVFIETNRKKRYRWKPI